MQVHERTARTERTTSGHDRYDPTVIPPTRITLQPIAPPSILGLYGFAGATLIVAAHQAGLYGGSTSAQFLFPFAAFSGGLAQFMAGMWGFRARDGLATAMHEVLPTGKYHHVDETPVQYIYGQPGVKVGQ